LTTDEYREAIARLGLSQVQAAKRLGVDPRTSRDWARTGPPPSVAVALALAVFLATMGVDPFGIPAVIAAAQRPEKKPPSAS
jgi:transcriptional regulator with XRE-family HTH domain